MGSFALGVRRDWTLIRHPCRLAAIANVRFEDFRPPTKAGELRRRSATATRHRASSTRLTRATPRRPRGQHPQHVTQPLSLLNRLAGPASQTVAAAPRHRCPRHNVALRRATEKHDALRRERDEHVLHRLDRIALTAITVSIQPRVIEALGPTVSCCTSFARRIASSASESQKRSADRWSAGATTMISASALASPSAARKRSAEIGSLAIAQKIKDLVKPPESESATVDWRTILTAGLHVSQSVADLVHLGPVVALGTAAFEIADKISTADGSADASPDLITATAAEIGGKLSARFAIVRDGLITLRDLVLSDPDKLKAVEQIIASGAWDPATKRNSGALIRSVDASLRTELWGGLLPLIFDSAEISREVSNASAYECYFGPMRANPFEGAKEDVQFLVPVGFRQHFPIRHPKILGNPVLALVHRPTSPPDAMADELFGTEVVDGRQGLGLSRPEFFDQYFKQEFSEDLSAPSRKRPGCWAPGLVLSASSSSGAIVTRCQRSRLIIRVRSVMI